MTTKLLFQQWINKRRAEGHDGHPMLYAYPPQNILRGLQTIIDYLGVRSPVTLYQWVELYGFPAIKTPEGTWLTSMTAIDQWIFLAAQMDNEKRPVSRGHNARLSLAKQRITARLRAAEAQNKQGEGESSS